MLLKKEEDDEEYEKNVEIIFSDIMYILHHQFLYTGYFSHILHLGIIKRKKLKVKNILIYGFQWG